MSDDSSDDDDLLLNAGLSRSTKRNEDKKRNAHLDFLKGAAEDDAKKRQAKALRRQVVEDNTDLLLAEAEEKVALSEKRKLEKLAENEMGNSERQLRAARVVAIETSRSDLIGTRPMKQAKHSSALPDFETIVLKSIGKSDKSMMKYLQKKVDMDLMPLVLERRTLARNKLVFPEPLEKWLWRCSLDQGSECAAGAYETLKEYYSLNGSGRSKHFTLTDMMKQWKEWLQVSDDAIERDQDDMLLDVQHYLSLWGVLLESYPESNECSAEIVSDILMELSQVVLDKEFYEGERHLRSAWCKVVSCLIELVRSRSSEDEWNSWMNVTCIGVLDVKVAPAPANAEDVDDIDGLLSRNLLVQAFLSVTPKVFGSNLGMVFLQRCAGIADWDEEIPKHFTEKHDWLVKESLESSCSWKLAACISCTYAAVEAKGDEIKSDCPRFLACVKTTSKLIAARVLGLIEGEGNAAKWWKLTENQVMGLAKLAMRFASQAHYRRAEIELSYLKTCINDNKVLDPDSIQPVQSSIDNWLTPKSDCST